MKVRMSIWVVALAGLGCFAIFAAKPTALGLLAALAAFLVTVVVFVTCTWRAIFRWKDRGWSGFAAPLVLIMAVPAGVAIGHVVRDWQFSRDMPRYSAAVTWASGRVASGNLVVLEPPPEYADLAYVIHTRQSPECGLLIDFFWGAGFPVKHTVRRFASMPSFVQRKECTTNWTGARKLTDNWYELSD